MVGAEEALAGGLVSRVVASEELGTGLGEMATEIIEHASAVSVAASRRLLWSMLGESSPWTAHYLETHIIRELRLRRDSAERAASFLEKRSPNSRCV